LQWQAGLFGICLPAGFLAGCLEFVFFDIILKAEPSISSSREAGVL